MIEFWPPQDADGVMNRRCDRHIAEHPPSSGPPSLDPLRLVLVPMVVVGGMAVAFVDVVVVISVAH